ncbi:FHA domain-containing protein [Blastococcus sp. TF02A-26]|uniref:FHA domain-containing protein n=1 Tax=Blastococcus sp. TF02A-26 TaxID=2250577 RepID=UPI000DE9E03F|nr:FHA domain-containing protein [Blastococcus sp. TF02A-26]RBY83130.1 hypothetical protein DQ240_17105 [Blastococcus sp. TF02A-26]
MTPPVRTAPAAAPPAVGVPPFDQVAVAVVPGADLVVRLPGIVLVVAAGTSAPAPARGSALGGWGAAPAGEPAARPAAGDRRAGELVALCRRVSAAGRRAPGRRLHEELRAWLPTATGVPSFALAAATEEGLALALLGDGVAEVPDLGLRLTSAQGEQPLPDGRPYLDRLVAWPPAALRLSAGATSGTAPHPLADLEAGVVPGAGAVLSAAPVPGTPTAPAPPSTGGTVVAAVPTPPVVRPSTPPVPPAHPPARSSGSAPAPPAPSAPVAPLPVELPPPARSVSFLDPPAPEEVEPPRPPLPVVTEPQPPGALRSDEADPRPRVAGILCKNGHLNDPRVLFCAQCGIRTTQQTAVPVEGVRPPLGLLVFDDGATVSLDADYLLGREPETDPRVRGAGYRPLLVVDHTGGVSRHHAEIRLEGWDVVLTDIGSANGTLFARRGDLAWTSLIPGQPVQLLPGTTVRMGGRQFTFESPHGGY